MLLHIVKSSVNKNVPGNGQKMFLIQAAWCTQELFVVC